MCNEIVNMDCLTVMFFLVRSFPKGLYFYRTKYNESNTAPSFKVFPGVMNTLLNILYIFAVTLTVHAVMEGHTTCHQSGYIL